MGLQVQLGVDKDVRQDSYMLDSSIFQVKPPKKTCLQVADVGVGIAQMALIPSGDPVESST